ncbi:tRNA preQ1(34) S-adenosylmethionine ribosyltransferase-isomerase QueA [Mycoplasmatota bacterium]|nr:tRNA preQ1(34) S-adenosylmethionine ribosyltransferase-isomerase QueA [Mycoplasmatota bacterium]
MKTSDFDFNLDKRLIAQTPLNDRSSSKLMVLDKKSGKIIHDKFSNITNYLKKGDVLVLNDTRVLPARLLGIKEDTGANIELMLLNNLESNVWKTLVKPLKRIKLGTVITFGNGELKAKCIRILDEGIIHVEMLYEGIFYEVLDKLGEMPLPPYITEKLEVKDRYQTVYAKNIGSVAAPTAGLHFTGNLIEKVEKMGVQIAYVTLHVGLGTFRPIKVENVLEHKMHSEFYSLTQENANILNEAKGRIVSVGTTSTRTLETIHSKFDSFKKDSGWTDIFIYPGYKFKAVDALITNFHLPKSTLIMLVSAFSKKEFIMNAYEEATKNEYRFFSFGDSMFIK